MNDEDNPRKVLGMEPIAALALVIAAVLMFVATFCASQEPADPMLPDPFETASVR